MGGSGLLFLLAQGDDDAAAAAGIAALFGGAFMLIWLVVVVVVIAGLWKVFEKAGKPGWAAIVPIYNAVVMCEISGKPAWWVLLMFIPCVGIVVEIIVLMELAKRFGKDAVFGILMVLFPFIFFPILGFGDAKYQGAGTPAA